MSRLDARLAKLENGKTKKPVIWAFLPKPKTNLVSELEKDKDMLREFASRYFGITEFYFSIFTASKGTSLSFSYIEYADFCEVISSIPSKKKLLADNPPPPSVVRERNEILADNLEHYLFGDEAGTVHHWGSGECA
jgi:hypothetical protein